MEKKYLKFYREWIKTGRLSGDTSCLCDLFNYGGYPEFDLFIPTADDFNQLRLEGFSTYTWASGDLRKDDEHQFFTFTPLRQNIVLLMAAMNNEL